MREPYRTLLGHFRHEIGHYYFDRLVTGTQWEEPFRELFGDERADYAAALKAHYEEGPPADWAVATSAPTRRPIRGKTGPRRGRTTCTSSTRSTRPPPAALELQPATRDNEPTLTDSSPIENETFDNLMKRWFPLTYALNSLNRSLGLADAYPFTLAPRVIDKLRFVHKVIASAATPDEPMPKQTSEPPATRP